MKRSRMNNVWTLVGPLLALAFGGCDNATVTSSQSGTGGSSAVSNGGASATGGVASTGGSVASGGVSGGGGNGSGGALATETGGKVASTGGRATGGAATGGSVVGGTGGRMGTGGSGTIALGSGGSAVGGSASGGRAGGTGSGTGGTAGGGATSTAPSGDPIPSTGCSATPTTTSACSGTASAPCTIDVTGTKREYYLNLPTGYDGKKPVPVVWEYHPLGGNAKQGIAMYGLNSKLTNVIFVSPQGLTSGGNAGFPNTSGSDEAMTRAINAEIEAKYCIDKARYFATGFSYGGSMSYTAACNMSDVFRAIGSMAGAPISGATCTSKKPVRPVAVWATHGDADTALPITMAQPIIDAFVKNNGCTSTTKPVEPSPCVEYQGCMEGYPVIWCIRPGDPHAIPSSAAAAIAKFFQQF